MKTLSFFLFLSCVAAQAQLERIGFVYNNGRTDSLPTIKQPVDPIRVVGGQTNSILALGWVTFSGKVVGVHSDGIRVFGSYWVRGTASIPEETDFFVANFPYQMADGDQLWVREVWMAKESGTYTYTTVLGARRTIRKLDYGTPVGLPDRQITPQERIAMADALVAKRQAQSMATIQYFETRAATNDAYAQFRLGEIYRDGAGVEKDLVKARAWFQKAAANGQPEAPAALSRLPRQSPAAAPQK